MKKEVVLILGSGPNALESGVWEKSTFSKIVAINNAWKVRADWDYLIYPEDFPRGRRPERLSKEQALIGADRFVAAQNRYGGFVYGGGTMAFTAAYWVLDALRPDVMAFLGCDMKYPRTGRTHFYGNGAADPLRPDITLQDLGAKSARLALIAAGEGVTCVNLSRDSSELLFPRTSPGMWDIFAPMPGAGAAAALRQEKSLGYQVPSGRYWEQLDRFDAGALAEIDAVWRNAYEGALAAHLKGISA